VEIVNVEVLSPVWLDVHERLAGEKDAVTPAGRAFVILRAAVSEFELAFVTVTVYVALPAVPAVRALICGPTLTDTTRGRAKAGVTLLTKAATSMDVRTSSRVPDTTKRESNLFVFILFSLALYGQLLSKGGSTLR